AESKNVRVCGDHFIKGALLKYFGPTSATPGPSTTMTGTSSEASGASTPSSDVSVAAEDIAEVPQPSTSSSDPPEAVDISEAPAPQPSTSSFDMIPATEAMTDVPPSSSTGIPSATSQDPPAFDWPSVLSDADRTEIVRRGPFQVDPSFTFPRRQDGRCFYYHYMYRKLINVENIKRSWFVYSKKNNAVYSFCCKLYSSKSYKLVKEGLSDWMNIGSLLKAHENSPDHNKHMVIWKELELRLKKGKTIDQVEMEVLSQLIAIIQSLAERNLGLRGTADTLHCHNNGNFLKEVKLLAKFDPVMRQHVNQIESGMYSNSTYLGKTIQNEFIGCISDKIMETMVAEIKQSKYYAIILDCTPDLSHQEQMSVVIRTMKLGEAPEIKEHFLGFLTSRLEELNIPFSNCRGQSYDNSANIKGKNKGVQARLLEKNPRALYVPCGAHTLNLVVADAAKNSVDATSFFGHVQKIYNLFSAATQRWSILKQHVTITVKSWSETRWESHVNSIIPLRYQASGIRDALLEVRQKATDAITKVEAQSLAEEVGSYRFQICTVVWHDILFMINTASKLLQSPQMHLDVAVNLLESTKSHLLSYRDNGFAAAQASAKNACEEMHVDAVLKKRLRSTKTHFAYESPDEPVKDALKRLETTFFNVIVDSAITTLSDRFETLGRVESKFGVLQNFSALDEENTLRIGEEADIDGRELASEIRNLPQLPTNRMSAFELLDLFHKKELTELYPNLWISPRIACTLPVTVASAERSFSKLKLIKTYLRSSMAQDRLTGLAIISINHEVGKQKEQRKTKKKKKNCFQRVFSSIKKTFCCVSDVMI
uniref:TTF-type domain-containing protein n=1 Tax=Acanthochromis polyacanthus TaxID=80966 RepID=A0A3Q1EGE4_9TELE